VFVFGKKISFDRFDHNIYFALPGVFYLAKMEHGLF